MANIHLPALWKEQLEKMEATELAKFEYLVKNNQTSPLKPDKESTPFLLFVTGHTLDDISQKMAIPKDVIYLTYFHFNWEEKKQELAKMGNIAVINGIQKNIVNNLLIATHMAITRQLDDVLSGKLEARKCSIIPQNVHSLKLFLEMVSELNKITEGSEKTTNIIHAENVQINQNIEKVNQDMVDFLESKDG